jgi:hypothetical protein
VSRSRFGLLIGLLAVLVAVVSFLVGVAVLDDGSPDEPPGAGDAPDGDAADDTTTSSTTEAPAGPLETPAFVVVVFSERDEAAAQSRAQQITDAGFPSGVLRSDDYATLNPGYWVAYSGPFPDAGAATSANQDLVGAGFTGSYVRCVGTAEEC